MKSIKFDQSPNFEERLTVAIPADLKAKVFANATRRGLSASTVVREALIAFTCGRATSQRHLGTSA